MSTLWEKCLLTLPPLGMVWMGHSTLEMETPRLNGGLILLSMGVSYVTDHGQIADGKIHLSSYSVFLSFNYFVIYRAELQRAFFPPAYRNSEVTAKLNPGDKRVWSALHIFLELRDETTLHIPFREAAKVINSSLFFST
jgi:hypothetical protein